MIDTGTPQSQPDLFAPQPAPTISAGRSISGALRRRPLGIGIRYRDWTQAGHLSARRDTCRVEPTFSPFLSGALAWISNGTVPDRCDVCGFEWAISSHTAVDAIEAAPERYVALLASRDGMVAAGDGGWNATAYLWHLVDLARSWSERWIQVEADPGSLLAGWDPDELAAARNYLNLPTVPALWALEHVTRTFVELSRQLDHDTTFQHGDWGTGTVADGLRWLAHEYTHHQLDVEARAR